jgi:hypothetical protein
MSQLVKTKRQANFKGFKRLGAFMGLVEQKKTLYSTRSCVNWVFLALVPKNSNLHKNSSNNSILKYKLQKASIQARI